MAFYYWFSRRLRLGKEAEASTSTGAVIAVIGVALALMVMELSLAVTAGFKHEIERKVIGFDAAISVMPPYDYQTGSAAPEMRSSKELINIISNSFPGARGVETSRRHAIMKTDSDFIAVEAIAYGEGHDWSFEKGNLIEGNIPADGDSIVISEAMAHQLGADMDSRPFLYFFIDGKPKARRVAIAGIYNSNFGDYDKSVIYATLPLLQGLGDDPKAITAINVEGIETNDISHLVEQSRWLQGELVEQYRLGHIDGIHGVTNVVEHGAIFFSWLNLLDTNVVVIFVLMLCVAAFTLISSLFIIILDRVVTIGILRSMGATRSQVGSIFISMALRIVGLGMIIGNVLAIGIILIQKATHILPLNPEMYYLDSVPFEITWTTIAWLNAGVIFVAWLILILPARLAARIDPASTMRYE